MPALLRSSLCPTTALAALCLLSGTLLAGQPGEAAADLVEAGYAALDADSPGEALHHFQLAKAGGATGTYFRMGYGMALAETGAHARAESVFGAVVASDPEHALAWNRKGVAQYSQLVFDRAIPSLRRAVDLRPGEGFFHESLAWALLCDDQWEAAVRSALRAMLIYEETGEDPAFSLLLTWYGLRLMGDRAEADKILHFGRNRLNPVVWPFPLFAYFGGVIDADSMIVEVTDRHQETEARAYFAAEAILDQRPDEALPHLRWIRRAGSRQVFEQVWAETLLRDIEVPGPDGTAAQIGVPAGDGVPSG